MLNVLTEIENITSEVTLQNQQIQNILAFFTETSKSRCKEIQREESNQLKISKNSLTKYYKRNSQSNIFQQNKTQKILNLSSTVSKLKHEIRESSQRGSQKILKKGQKNNQSLIKLKQCKVSVQKNRNFSWNKELTFRKYRQYSKPKKMLKNISKIEKQKHNGNIVYQMKLIKNFNKAKATNFLKL